MTKQIAAKKLTATATVEARYTKNITYKPVPVTAIATVEAGAAGLTGGDAKAEEKKAEEKKGGAEEDAASAWARCCRPAAARRSRRRSRPRAARAEWIPRRTRRAARTRSPCR